VETTVRYLGNLKFEAAARGHRLICDQPVENQGSDKGMTPPELLLASLGTCAGYYAVQYLGTRGLNAHRLTVRVSAEKATQPARLASFVVEVEAPDIDPKHHDGLLRAVNACLIHNTLSHTPAFDLHVHVAAPTVA
jgi:putative redox protein